MTVLGQCSHASALYNAIVALAARRTRQKLAVYKLHVSQMSIFSEKHFFCQGKSRVTVLLFIKVARK